MSVSAPKPRYGYTPNQKPVVDPIDSFIDDIAHDWSDMIRDSYKGTGVPMSDEYYEEIVRETAKRLRDGYDKHVRNAQQP